MDDIVEEPVSPKIAFLEAGAENLDSRVTFFLLLGVMYGWRRYGPLIRDIGRFREEFSLPEIETGEAFQTSAHLQEFERKYEIPPLEVRSLFSPEDAERTSRRRGIVSDLVQRMYRSADRAAAADILLLGLGDPEEFTRVAAAISFIDMFAEVGLAARVLINILDETSNDLVRRLAEIALHRLGGQASPPLPPFEPIARVVQTTSNSTIMIHGTHFAFVGDSIGTWWKPGGDFHTFIREKFRPNLYDRPDYFTWSGGWSDHARGLAALDLRSWAAHRRLSGFDVIAHSHGGNVAMWATQVGVNLGKLILLSCPVHTPYFEPDFNRVREIVSFQIKLDWVILADRGGTYFNHSRIKDYVLPQWFFRHNDTHEADFWKKHKLAI